MDDIGKYMRNYPGELLSCYISENIKQEPTANVTLEKIQMESKELKINTVKIW